MRSSRTDTHSSRLTTATAIYWPARTSAGSLSTSARRSGDRDRDVRAPGRRGRADALRPSVGRAHPGGQAGGDVELRDLDSLVRLEVVAVGDERTGNVRMLDQRVQDRERLVPVLEHRGDCRLELRLIAARAALGLGGMR